MFLIIIPCFKLCFTCFAQIRCKEVRRADHVSVPLEKKIPGELNQGSASGFCYSIEIKDSYLPPWIISSICNCLDSDENSYDIR